jgi:hypothetical protein
MTVTGTFHNNKPFRDDQPSTPPRKLAVFAKPWLSSDRASNADQAEGHKPDDIVFDQFSTAILTTLVCRRLTFP